MNWLLILIPVVPFMLFFAACIKPLGKRYSLLLVLAPLPALLLAIAVPDLRLTLTGLLFEVVLDLNYVSRAVLAMASVLWTLGGIFCYHYLKDDPARRRFSLFWLLTLTGNLLLIVAQDIASFYTGFTLMTFSAYGLIVHSGEAEARQAGRIYLSMAVIGEVMILGGLLAVMPHISEPLLAQVPVAIAESEIAELISLLLFAGFGVKAGIIGMHMWLPLAHPVAPTPASAVLSGSMIKAGLLAWLHLLPLGKSGMLFNYELLAWGIIALGLLAAFAAGVVGVLQVRVKAVLAYSSISQMGLMTVLVGVGMLEPDAWTSILVVITVYAVHHGLAKGALFFMVGMAQYPGSVQRRWLVALAVLPALALVGAPLSSGASAKKFLSGALYGLESVALIVPLLSFAAVATGILMVRYLWLLWHTDSSSKRYPSIFWAVSLSIVSVVAGFWFMPLPDEPGFLATISPSSLAGSLWPIAAAILLGGVALLITRRFRVSPEIPAGDMIWPLQTLLRRMAALYKPVERRIEEIYQGALKGLGYSSVLADRGRACFTRRFTEQTLTRYIVLSMTLLFIVVTLIMLF